MQPMFKLSVSKGLTSTNFEFDRSRYTKNGYTCSGRITFGSVIYKCIFNIIDMNGSLSGSASITTVDYGNKNVQTTLNAIPSNDDINVEWNDIKLPMTSAIGSLTLVAKRQNNAAQAKPAQAARPKSLRKYLMAGGNASAQKFSTIGSTSSSDANQCDNHGWPSCCQTVNEGRLNLPE